MKMVNTNVYKNNIGESNIIFCFLFACDKDISYLSPRVFPSPILASDERTGNGSRPC